MVWHIARRELAGILLTLRFPLAAALIVGLFLVNALVFVGTEYPERTRAYARQTARSQEELRKHVEHLNELATRGPGTLPRRPSPLAFAASGREKVLPVVVDAQGRGGYGYGTRGFQYRWTDPWALSYPYALERANPALNTFLEVDWAFILGIVVSFIALAFTYDAVCGEREDGTLRLMLAAPIPRHQVLLGKALGAFLGISVPVFLGLVLNLLIVMLSGQAVLGTGEWIRIGLMFFFSLLYIGIFVFLGLFISARCQRAATSLLALLLVWVIFVILVPNTFGSIAAQLEDIPSEKSFQRQREQALQERAKSDDLYKASPSDTPPDPAGLDHWASYLGDGIDIYTRLTDAHLDAQFRQVEKARSLMRFSPAAVYQYTLEALAGTGFSRYKDFVQSTRRYRNQFITFIKEKDRTDPDSPHVYPVKEGLSTKSVELREIPPFTDVVMLRDSLSDLALDAGILLFLCLLLFVCAYLSFLRYDPR